MTQNTARSGGSVIDGRTTRHEGYLQSIIARRDIEKVFGWIKEFGGLREFKAARSGERQRRVWPADDRLQSGADGQSAKLAMAVA